MRNPARAFQMRTVQLARRRNALSPHRAADTEGAAEPEPRRQARQTPRMSLIVVVADNESVRIERVQQELGTSPPDDRDVIFACAGRPANLMRLSRRVHDAQFIFAPPGTSCEDLRELGIRRAHGDIITLVNGMGLRSGSASSVQAS